MIGFLVGLGAGIIIGVVIVKWDKIHKSYHMWRLNRIEKDSAEVVIE